MDVQVHMTATIADGPFGPYRAVCRCEWQSPTEETRDMARKRGDAHLAEANSAHVRLDHIEPAHGRHAQTHATGSGMGPRYGDRVHDGGQS